MSWVATSVRERCASNIEAKTGSMSLLPTPLQVNRSKAGGSSCPQSPILSQLKNDVDGLRKFHLEKLRHHGEIDDTIGCYAGLARHGSKKSSLLPRITDQGATRATLRRRRAATSLRDPGLDKPSKKLNAEIENYLSPETLEAVDRDFIIWACQEGISYLVRSAAYRNSFEVIRPAPNGQITFGMKALRDCISTYRRSLEDRPNLSVQ